MFNLYWYKLKRSVCWVEVEVEVRTTVPPLTDRGAGGGHSVQTQQQRWTHHAVDDTSIKHEYSPISLNEA